MLMPVTLAACATSEFQDWTAHRAVLLFFVGTECPVSNLYAPEIERIAKQAAPRDVAVFSVYPDPELTQEAADRHGRDFGHSTRALLDGDHSG